MNQLKDLKYYLSSFSSLFHLTCLINLIIGSIKAWKSQKTKQIYRTYISWTFYIVILIIDNCNFMQNKIPYYLILKLLFTISINLGKFFFKGYEKNEKLLSSVYFFLQKDLKKSNYKFSEIKFR